MHTLRILQSDHIDYSLLAQAFKATATKRDSAIAFENLLPELEKVLTDAEIKRLWENYRKKFNYAADLEWNENAKSLRKLFLSVKEAERE